MIDAIVQPVSHVMIADDTQLCFSDPSAMAGSTITELQRGLEAFGTALAPMVGRFLAATMPIARAVQEILQRPDVQEALAAKAQTLVQAHERIAAVEAPGYTPYFERLGYGGLLARLHVLMIRSCADRVYRESQDKRIALSALHDLARRPRWHPALRRQAERLRDNCWEADFVTEACRRAGGPELRDEFMDQLHGAGSGDHAAGQRLVAIAKRIVPYAPSPRGRPIAFDTILHQTFLRWSAEFGGRRGYTYGAVPTGIDAVDDYIDEATAAARIELKRPSFNPSSARRAERRRMARETARDSVVGRL